MCCPCVAWRAVSSADSETKKKQLRVNDIKKLNQEISKVENEITKYDEQLSACLKYKDFLDKLAPDDWKNAQKERRAKRRSVRLIH